MLWLLALACVWFVNIQYRSLTEPDEGRYAEIPREMLARGDWLTPHLNGIPYFEKPPLQYWATAAAYAAFGVAPWSSRLWTSGLGLLGAVLVGLAGRRLYGAKAGLLAAAALVSSPLYVILGHINTLDMGLTFFLGAAVIAFAIAQERRRGEAPARGWMLLSWSALALAALTKGPVALVLAGATVAGYVSWQRDFGLLRRLAPLTGLAALAVLAAPWFVAMSLRHPGFAEFYFIHEHFARFTSHVHQRLGPWWYFVPIVLVGCAPWLGAIGRGVRETLRSGAAAGGFDSARFLLVWSLVVLLFFSASGSKLPAYVLPMWPALALLAGRALASHDGTAGRTLAFAQWCGVAAAGVCLAVSGWFAWGLRPPARAVIFEGFVPWLFAAALVFALGSVVVARLRFGGRFATAGCAVAWTWLLALQVALTGHESLAPIESGRNAAARLARLTDPTTPLFAVGSYPQTVTFYLGRELTLVGDPGELEVQFAPGTPRWIPDLRQFALAWRSSEDPVAIVDRDALPALRGSGVPAEIIEELPDSVIITRPGD